MNGEFQKNHIKLIAYCTITNDETKRERSFVIRYYQNIEQSVSGEAVLKNLLEAAADAKETKEMLEKASGAVHSEISNIELSVGDTTLSFESSEQLRQFDMLKEWVDYKRREFPQIKELKNQEDR